MKFNWSFKRYLIFVTILLIAFPLILSVLINGAGYNNQIRAVFLLQRLYLTMSALLLILIIISYNKIEAYKPKLKWKETIILFTATIICFLIAFSTQISYEKIISYKPDFTDRAQFDSTRWLAPNILGDSDPVPSKNYALREDDEIFARNIKIGTVPEDPSVIWHSGWQEIGGKNDFSNCNITLQVNQDRYDITSEYLDSTSKKSSWHEIKINKSGIKTGDNILAIRKICPNATVTISSQTTYIKLDSRSYSNGKWETKIFDEYLITIKQESNLTEIMLFKLGFILRVLGILLLFLAIFTIDFGKFLLKNARIELGFSFIYSLIMYWFSQTIREYWLVLSKIVTYTTYFLLKISFLHPIINFSNPAMPVLGVPGFIVGMADTCSGIDSIAYFVLAYSILIIINWQNINIKKALILFIPGLFGTIIVNTIRIYLLFIIGIFFSKEFATNAYHTNAGMVLFIIYFLVFWMMALKYVQKEKTKEKLDKISNTRVNGKIRTAKKK